MQTPLDKRTALHFAAAGGHLDVVKALIQNTEHPAKPDLPDRFGMLPIHEAATAKHYDVRAYLFELEEEHRVRADLNDLNHSVISHGSSSLQFEPVFSPPRTGTGVLL